MQVIYQTEVTKALLAKAASHQPLVQVMIATATPTLRPLITPPHQSNSLQHPKRRPSGVGRGALINNAVSTKQKYANFFLHSL